MDGFEVSQGAALPITAVIRDSAGLPVTGYTGSETLATTLWPGGTRAASATPATTWTNAGTATIAIAVTAAQTVALDPGQYQLLTRVTVAGVVYDAYRATIDVLAAAGTGTAPPSYTSYSDLFQFGRSWLRQLETSDDLAGFMGQQGRARTWLEDCGHAHYQGVTLGVVVGSQYQGPQQCSGRSVWLTQQFAANTLIVTAQVREACAKKALAYICEAQVGVGEASAAYGRLARMYHAQADALACCLVLGLDTGGTGVASTWIDLSYVDPLYG